MISAASYGGNSILTNPGTGPYSWTATANDAWVSLSGTQGTVAAGGQNPLAFSVQQNSSTSQRVGTISVFAPNTGNGAQTITITQDGQTISSGPILALSTNQLDAGAGAGNYAFDAYNQGTGSINYSAVSDAGWLTFPYPTGTIYPSGVGIPFAVQENGSISARNATITVFASGASNSPQTIAVTQAGQSTVLPPLFAWANVDGTVVTGLAIDGQGNAFAVGYFSGTTNFGGVTLTASGDADIFVAKLNSAGGVIWAQRAGSTGSSSGDYGYDVKLDQSGNVYIVGQYIKTATFGTISVTSSGSADVFLAKYDPNGNILWVRSAGGQYGDGVGGFAVDSSGNCYLTGAYTGTSATFGTTTLTNTGGQFDSHPYLAEYNSSGTFVFVKGEGGTALSLDASNNLYMAGASTASNQTFSGVTVSNGNTTAGTAMAYLVKYNSSNNVIWARSVSSANGTPGFNSIQASGLAQDASGDSYLSGMFSGKYIFGVTSLSSLGTDDSYLCKFDSAGNILWVRQNGSPSTGSSFVNNGIDVTTDGSGNVYQTGAFMGTAAFGNTNLTSRGDRISSSPNSIRVEPSYGFSRRVGQTMIAAKRFKFRRAVMSMSQASSKRPQTSTQ